MSFFYNEKKMIALPAEKPKLLQLKKVERIKNTETEAEKQNWRNLPFFCHRHKRKLKMSFAN